jgi:TRAP-type uncharacterized transport system substrate-binding protein
VAAIVVTFAVIVGALVFTEPMPPRTVVMATGTEGTAYYDIGQHYRSIFARHGVILKVLATNGSVDNIERLNDPHSGVSAALVQSGTTNEKESPELVSLGTLFYEPLWLFSRTPPREGQKVLRPGMHVSLGTPGSGTYKLTHDLTDALGIDLSTMTQSGLGENAAGEVLMQGKLDVVAMSMSWNASIIQKLLKEPDITLIGWPRADALVALRPFLSKRILPRGVGDLRNDLPPQDITLIATRASLIVRDDLHPALQHLLLEAASEIHGGPGVFNKSGEFPTAEPIDLPLSEIAREYYRNGIPFLQRYLPFWLAALASRAIVLLIPIVGVIYPLFRLLPALYGWSMRRRIFLLYGELKFLEAEFEANTGGGPAVLMEELDHLEARANQMRVPMAFAHLLYTLKHHIGLVRDRIRDGGNAKPART